jgi:hypothetical protein
MSKERFVFDIQELPRVGETTWRCHSSKITFSNGWTISMIYGSGTYCNCTAKFDDGCPDVEIAIMDHNGVMIEFKHGDTVKGFTKPDELSDIMQWVKNQPKPKENAENVS